MEKYGNTYTIAATDHFKCVRDSEPGMFRIYGSNNFCTFDIGIFEHKTRLDNAKDVMDGFRDLSIRKHRLRQGISSIYIVSSLVNS